MQEEMEEFDQLFVLYYEDVLAFLLSRTNGNWSLAEEITQETFYQAYQSIHRYQPDASIKTWLCQIGIHMLGKYWRKHKREMQVMEDAKVCNQHETSLAATMNITVIQAIHTLDERSQSIVIARLYFEKSFAMIGQQHQISESSARVIFHRAKQKLQQYLKGVIKDETTM